MDLAQISVRRPIFITCVVTLILFLGYMGLNRLPVDLFPNITNPIVVVTVLYPGAGPVEVETLVAKVLEEEISSISGLERLRSINQEGVSTIVAEFALKLDIKYVEQQVRDRVSSARNRLPDDLDEPMIRTVDPADQAVAVVSVSAPDKSPGELYDIAEQTVKAKLDQVPQVGQVKIYGGRKREIQVQLDMNKLRAYKISATEVTNALKISGENVPAGKTTGAKTESTYRTLGEYNRLDQIPPSVARFTGDEHPLTIAQIGKVVDSLEDETTRTFQDGQPALLLYVYRQSGANTIEVVDRVRATAEKLNTDMKSRGMNVHTELVKDGAKRIRDNVYDVKESIIIGIFLTVIVVYFFLGSFRSTLITGLALPNSLLGAFAFMLWAGFSINIMSLLALSLAVGLLIDDAIVVRENIFRHLEMGKSPEEAALAGTREVRLAVVATTLAILAVFGPIGFLEGVTGQWFKEFGLTICFAMLVSLFDALTIAPMLSAYFAGSLHAKPKSKFGQWNERILKGFDRFQTWLEDKYEIAIHWTLRRPKTVIVANLAIFLFSIYCLKFVSKTFVPAPDNGEFKVALELPPGTSIDGMAVLGHEVDAKIREFPEVKRTLVSIGDEGESNVAEISVELHPLKRGRTMSTSDFKAKVRDFLKPYEYAKPAVMDGDAAGGGGRQFNMNLSGPDLKELEAFAAKVVERLKPHKALTDVDSDFKPGKPEFQFQIDPEIAREAGLNPRVVGNELRNLVEGVVAGQFRSNDLQYDIRVRAAEDQRELQSNWKNILVPNINKTLVPLGLVAEISPSNTPAKITRENRARTIQVSADIDPKGPGMGAIMADIPKILKEELQMPAGINYSFYGQAERMKELGTNMVMAMGLGVLFIFFVLASLYESFITPLAIMLVLPLAAVGAFLGLLVTRESLNLFSMIGCVMLLGLASKNSILLVDYIQQLTDEGMERSQAIVKACRTRLRPILMTSFALIAGMVPVAIGLNEASRQRTSLGVAVIGGVISSTLLTLVLVPAAYIYIDNLKQWTERLFLKYVRGAEAAPKIAWQTPDGAEIAEPPKPEASL
ncbi:MAG: efflux RND transporter permease subunit [Bdellovibrionales bacterium]|nr:efflux RND transporter permease subunit [Bdellovibrionales bacterium]